MQHITAIKPPRVLKVGVIERDYKFAIGSPSFKLKRMQNE